ncbi:uncharacterized protein K452DRAFT_295938 [Aplosporella prunicola CBS 121167]|uniref:Uncharacterized protein n=1 Tax=Aplosporella prunicola CBS 121167 TaxID=1176127 RepID=A0A6A6BM73_9PEZI|nr:uncharacterized protein K452DRAFT_295938 [Aplosporella prunicola CBS 121167]KAF2144503.1 hypothetical protein K452DRAFT_295938 [Aplosporella prunicola CBS 121167]
MDAEERSSLAETITAATATASATFAIISHLPFQQGVVEPPTHQYKRAVVVPRTSEEDVSWIDWAFGNDSLLQKAIYTVDDPVEPYVLPANKGNEVMAYLTFIIDFYDLLPDVSIFMHAHSTAWHNNDLLEMGSSQILKRLNLRKVVREGYFNLRCHQYPGCSNRLFPLAKNQSSVDVPQEEVFEDAWKQLFPLEDVPEALAQPCCAQFAVSRERIQMLPWEQYIHFRKWVQYTRLPNNVSGRVWEYIYQYIWAGRPEFCPKENVCYCDGYGVCFGGEEEYNEYYTKKRGIDELKAKGAEQFTTEGSVSWPVDYASQLDELQQWLEQEREKAWQRGQDPSNRAREAGRPYMPGDGF